jgi:hypothetical protein
MPALLHGGILCGLSRGIPLASALRRLMAWPGMGFILIPCFR